MEIDKSKAESIWFYVKNNLRNDKSINANTYNNFLSKSYVYSFIGSNFIISSNTKITSNIIDFMHDKIKKIILKKYNIDINIQFKYIKKKSVINEIKNKIPINDNSSFYSKYLFSNFVTGDSNNQAFKAAINTALNPGKNWNPLFIYSDSGLGKTHLLYSIQNSIQKNYPNKKIKNISSEDFGKLSIDNMSKGYQYVENFKQQIKDNDVLLIDDIQLLAKRTKTNELLFNIFNYFIQNNKQIVITSDKIPEELGGFEQRLISRFSKGLSIKMKKPNFKTGLEIVKLKLKQTNNYKNFSIDAMEFLAKNFTNDIRYLEGAINRIIFLNILNTTKNPDQLITTEEIVEYFKDKKFITTKEKLTINEIKNFIAQENNFSIKVLCGKSRIKNIMLARQLAMYLSRILLNKSLSYISIEFGRKDHTTVINAIKKIELLIKTDKEFKKYVDNLKKKIIG